MFLFLSCCVGKIIDSAVCCTWGVYLCTCVVVCCGAVRRTDSEWRSREREFLILLDFCGCKSNFQSQFPFSHRSNQQTREDGEATSLEGRKTQTLVKAPLTPVPTRLPKLISENIHEFKMYPSLGSPIFHVIYELSFTSLPHFAVTTTN